MASYFETLAVKPTTYREKTGRCMWGPGFRFHLWWCRSVFFFLC